MKINTHMKKRRSEIIVERLFFFRESPGREVLFAEMKRITVGIKC